MHRGIRIWRRAAAATMLAMAVLTLAACGSSSSGSGSGSAQSLLKQTFAAGHKVNSGVLTFGLSMNPTGSSTLKGPILLSLSGPFQSRGTGKLPESNFSVNVSALGHHGQLGVVSTGTSGYVTLQGASYQLPAADFQKLDSSFASATPGSTGGGLSKLGIHPLHWLTNPTVVGQDTVAGASTTHIRAHVDVATLLGDFNTFLQKAASSAAATSSSIPTSIPPATRQKIASEIKNPSVDIWTGTSDKALRKLALNLNVPVSGQASTLLGGMTSAGVGFTLQYADLNKPQTISAPANVHPFTEFATKLQGIVQQVQGAFGAGGLGASTGSSGSTSSGSGTTGASSVNPSNVQKYTKCIQQASGDVTKMQKCASLLNGG
jgi:hypothetical protein